ncbi:MAG TPA: ribonuclease HI family protein [Terriglobales bacterium]|nr:ribonuclease HI family protein [Terriglobales bacterium]
MKSIPESYLIAHTDGGARGNPGPAGYGVVIHDSRGSKVAALSQYLGTQTNNFAEYQALIAALEYVTQQGYKALKVVSDSELLVRQIKGIYRVKEPTLRDLHARAKKLISQLDWFEIEHVLRGHNREADELANAAMDKGSGRTPFRVPQPPPRQSPIELNGIVRDGKIELLDGNLPEGTAVQVRVKP